MERLFFIWKGQTQAHEKLSISHVEMPKSRALNPNLWPPSERRKKRRQQHIFSFGNSIDDDQIINEKSPFKIKYHVVMNGADSGVWCDLTSLLYCTRSDWPRPKMDFTERSSSHSLHRQTNTHTHNKKRTSHIFKNLTFDSPSAARDWCDFNSASNPSLLKKAFAQHGPSTCAPLLDWNIYAILSTFFFLEMTIQNE